MSNYQNNRWTNRSRGGFRHKYENGRQNFNRNNNQGRDYADEHDDRNLNGNEQGNVRGPTIASGRVGPNPRNRPGGNQNRPNYTTDYRNKNQRKQGRRGGLVHQDRYDESTWFKFTIEGSAGCAKDAIMNQLQEFANQPFIAYNSSTDPNGNLCFFIKGEQLRSSLSSFSRRLQNPNGGQLRMKFDKWYLPVPNIDQTLIEKVKDAMSRRYIVEQRSLDLSNFSDDQYLREMCLFLPIQQKTILPMILNIISDNIPNLVALNLSGNALNDLSPLASFTSKCADVKILNLSNNRIPDIKQLENFKGWDLEELCLIDNPVSKTFKDETAYVSYVRNRFPNMLKLDNTILPPPICFDVEETQKLPKTINGYLPVQIEEFVTNFLKKYYSLFDSNDRQSLLPFYHEQALFSYSMPPLHDQKFKPRPFDTSLNQGNRNLLNVHGEERTKTLKQGKVNVVSALCVFPKSQHIMDSFLIDVPLCDHALLEIVINGVFKVTEFKNSTLKSFSRHFLIVPQGNEGVIINDQLFMTNPSSDVVKKYRTPQGAEAAFLQGEMDAQPINNQLPPQQLPLSNQMTPSTSSGFSSGGDPATSQMDQILSQFCALTKLNREFAHKCLSENNYDPERSFIVFKELHVLGRIPALAYE